METTIIQDWRDSEKCDKIFNLFCECAITRDTHVKSKCNQIKKNVNGTFMNLYIKCITQMKI